MCYARVQNITGKFVKDAFKKLCPKVKTAPSVKNKQVSEQYEQPNSADCGLFVVAKVLQLVRRNCHINVMYMSALGCVGGCLGGFVGRFKSGLTNEFVDRFVRGCLWGICTLLAY